MSWMETLFTLIFEFFKTGLFAVGGGLATVPFLAEIGEKTGWYGAELLSTILAVSESTPGPMGINMATYVGYSQLGVLGGIITTLSEVTPSIIVITIIAKMLNKFDENPYVQAVFSGIKPAVVGFIAAACISLFTSAFFVHGMVDLDLINIKALVLFVAVFVITRFFKPSHPIQVIVLCAIAGVVLSM